MLSLDHIVVAAETLDEGRAFVEERLGVGLQYGGQHPLMGTHNLLLGLEDGLYLEVIAIDPDAQAIARARWFGLDEFSGPPRLTNWVGRSDNLVSDMSTAFGQGSWPMEMQRGDLRWQMSILAQGQTPLDGCAPMMLDWGHGPKAADFLQPSGCRLAKLEIGHPDHQGLENLFGRIVDDPRISVEVNDQPSLTAILETPLGEAALT